MRFCMERTNLLNCNEILSCSIVHHCFSLRPKLFWCLFLKMHHMWLMFGSVSLKNLCCFLLSGFLCLLPDIVLFCEILWSIEMRFCMERTNLLNCHEMLSCSIVHHCFCLRPKLFWCLFPKMHRMCVNVWLSFIKEFVLLSLKQFLMPLAWHCSFCVILFVCLIWFFTSTQQSFSYAGRSSWVEPVLS